MTRRMLVLWLFLGLCSVSPARVLQAPAISADQSWNDESGPLKAWLGVTSEPRKLVKMFDEPSGCFEAVQTGISTTVPGQEIGVFLLFSGCQAGADGKCDAVATYEFFFPDGTLAVAQKDLPVWPWIPPRSGTIELARAVWVSAAEDSDPVGTNRIKATVTDRVAGRTLVLERELVLDKTGSPVR